MDSNRRSRSPESPRRHHRNDRSRREHRRHSRSRSRSRTRGSRERDRVDRRRHSPSRERGFHPKNNPEDRERDLYRDIIYEDYADNERNVRDNNRERDSNPRFHDDRENQRGFNNRFLEDRERDDYRFQEERVVERFPDDRNREMPRYHEDRERHFADRNRDKTRDFDRDRERRHRHGDRHRRGHSAERDESNDGYESDNHHYYYNETPNKTIIVRGLVDHITEADISSDLIQYGLKPTSIRLIRKRHTGASRGFAFVEFSTVEEAKRWMDYKQGSITLQDQHRAIMQYSHSKEPLVSKERMISDWYCAKCGVFNFKRRDNCFKCYASREESEKGGEGSDEVSNILTKKIMLRNLDVLTNEEGVLTIMQTVVPAQVSKIAKILICRDPLTQTSRGICYLHFDNLVDSMNTHNALKALEPPLQIDGREIIVTYCIDSENRHVGRSSAKMNATTESMSGSSPTVNYTANTYQYTVNDVPRLAEYSASLYSTTPQQHDHYLQYYTQYYLGEISKGNFGNLPTMTQLDSQSANSGAAVALSAIQRKQSKMRSIETTATHAAQAAAAAAAAATAAAAQAAIVAPRGNDGKVYPTPDVSLYQYDETSGYYYDPMTGLYYDAHSQYYYNNETGAYLYWNQEKSTYVLAPSGSSTGTAPPTSAPAASEPAVVAPVVSEEKKDPTKKEGKQDKVKVAKKIVKDMEKWAKQLNQKKENPYVATPQPILPSKAEEIPARAGTVASGYADVGFSILEKKKMNEFSSPSQGANKLVPSYASDSDEHEDNGGQQETTERDYVDYDKLTCLLCKRAFQSLDILNKHLKMSNLHKENLRKYNLNRDNGVDSDGQGNASMYRDRAKERRQKYGESDPPPPNRSKERFQKELKKVASTSAHTNAATAPIDHTNVGNRLLQKMGWSEGQGLGRSNQGRTKIIEAESRNSTAGLGAKTAGYAPGDDYKSYIKKMMKARYEQVP